MALIYETNNFEIVAPDKPHIDRFDGGHIVINPKVTVKDRTKLTMALGRELMRLSMVAGEAMSTALTQRGIDIGRINYQENGNWIEELHWHLYGRAKSAKLQPYGQALHFPKPEKEFYEGLEPLNAGDIEAIGAEIERLLQTEKYQEF
jgi:diadenosine tetraphosphate (Ap4A) HIT family hydrolase